MSSPDDLVTATKNLVIATNNLGEVLKKLLAVTTSSTATAGSGVAVPATVRNFLVTTEPGTGVTIKIPTFEV